MSLRRSLASLVGALSVATFAVAPHASAEPPEGCVGPPSVPQAYVCITEFNEENVPPNVDTSTGETYVVPAVCYLVGCTEDTPVFVPVPTATWPTGPIVVISYMGTDYPIYGPGGSLPVDPNAVVEEAKRQAEALVAFILETAGPVVAEAERIAGLLVDYLLLLVDQADDVVFQCVDHLIRSSVPGGDLVALVTILAGRALDCAGFIPLP